MKKLIDELIYRNILNNYTNKLKYVDKYVILYTGIDPTYKSLHIGHLMIIFTLLLFKKYNHTPLIVIGKATSMIGDPAGKYNNKHNINNELIHTNYINIKKQLKYIFNINSINIEILNNFLWIKKIKLLNFIKEIGNNININSMILKKTIKNKLNNYKNITFSEFTYQLFQAYDYYYLYKKNKCILQIGGSDQWGNIITGINFIKKLLKINVYGLTTNLITNDNGIKISKSFNKKNNIWLDNKLTSSYEFYQYWLNISDKTAEKIIKICINLSINKIKNFINYHNRNKNKRKLQKIIAKYMTIFVHGKNKYYKSKLLSKILFNKDKKVINVFNKFDNDFIKFILKNIKTINIKNSYINNNVSIINILTKFNIIKPKKKAILMIKSKSIFINEVEVNLNSNLNDYKLIINKLLLLKISKKKFIILNFF